MNQDETQSPISFPVNVARLPHKGMPVVIDANEKQRAALAGLHELLSVESLHADVHVTSWKRNGVRVSGFVRARITQACIVTLDPIEARIDEPVESVFLPEDSKLGRQGFNEGGEILLDADGPDSPEVFSGDVIDVGALVEEFFGLAIDPYPRKPGISAEFSDGEVEEKEETEFQKKLRDLSRKL
ncbi:YceD family protein [Oryzicola mucosus]|uniref:DUF177 domain-containing protein n=1 Tax=Oryzicola mucosus TaxID=2767425 RepID=A0A8J6U5M9_9HYPH|nr:DUF177 domain-containing protein [Oryzicola mucosus]MBD0416575.1 DUF177 domain-containing protein [Oryzicola mucosus]